MIVTGLTIIIAAAVFYITWLGVAEIKSFIANFEYLFIMVRQKTAGICLDVDGMLGLSDGCSLEFVCSCADRIRRIFQNGQPEEVVSSVLRISFPILVNTAVIAGAVIVCLISVVYLSGVLEKIRKWRENSIFREEVCALTLELKKLIQVYFKIELIIMLINAGICIAGLLLIHNPYAVVIGILIGLVDALPFFWHGDGTDSVGGYFTAVSQLLCRCGTAVRVCDDVFCPRNHGVKMYGRPAGHCYLLQC